jgi:lipopolysaccharide export system permease protein
MPILFRYVTRELVWVFLVVAVVILLIGMGGRFIGYLQDAAMGKFPGQAVLTIMLLRLPEFLQLVLPFAFFLALVLTVSRLFADQELPVLLASGVGPLRVLGWLLVSAAVLASIVAVLALRVTPALEIERVRFMHDQRAMREFEGLLEGVFHSFSGGDRVSYAEEVSSDRRRLRNVFLADRRGAAGSVTIWAEWGSQYVDERTGSRFLLLEQGRRYEGVPGFGDYRVVEFAAMGQRIEPPDPGLHRMRVQAMPTARLLADRTVESMAEFHWRLALPVMTLLAAPLGLGLARARPRQGRFSTLVPALVAVLGYYLLLLLNQHLLLRGVLPLGSGVWLAHGLALVAGTYLVFRLARPVRG